MARRIDLEYIRTDKNGTRYYNNYNCPRCGGSGVIPMYGHIEHGVCFKCGGSGNDGIVRVEKVYTEEYAQKLEDRRKARKIKKAEKENPSFLAKNGFNAETKMTYVFLGNTYEIKDELKKLGAQFNRCLGWHIDHKIDGYDMMEVEANDYFGLNIYGGYIEAPFNENEVKAKIKEANALLKAKNNPSDYVGNVGDTLDVKVKLTHIGEFESHYTYYGESNYIYNFDYDGNVIVWKTQKWLDIEEGAEVVLKGKIKDHKEYRGIKQTVMTRCKIA